MAAANLQRHGVKDRADLRSQLTQREYGEISRRQLLVIDLVLLLLRIRLRRRQPQTLLYQLLFGQRINTLGIHPRWLLFPSLVLESVP